MNDDQLISKAISTNPINWQDIINLIDLAEKEETKRYLDNIMKGKYHEDEFNSRMI